MASSSARQRQSKSDGEIDQLDKCMREKTLEMEGCGKKRWRTERCLLSGCVGEMRVQDRMGTGRDEYS